MIRAFQKNDFEEYLAMAVDFYDSPATDHKVAEDTFKRNFDEILSDSPSAAGWLIIAEDGRTAGYMLTAISWSTERGVRSGWLEELWLKEEYRSKGLGSTVMNQVMAELKEKHDVGFFRLEVAKTNLRVAELYRAMGFKDVPYHQMWRIA